MSYCHDCGASPINTERDRFRCEACHGGYRGIAPIVDLEEYRSAKMVERGGPARFNVVSVEAGLISKALAVQILALAENCEVAK